MECELIPLEELREHERIIPSHLCELREEINGDGFIRNPIIADRTSMVILDGHHRYNVAVSLGLRRIPVVLVDYLSPEIKVYPRRKNIKVTKEIIIQRGVKSRPFPHKTTRHVIPGRPMNVMVPLEALV